jgi:hypothetical protein
VELFEMRVSKDEKARTHAAIVKTAAALMRQNGIAQTGVAASIVISKQKMILRQLQSPMLSMIRWTF